jgi:hypothetical protein
VGFYNIDQKANLFRLRQLANQKLDESLFDGEIGDDALAKLCARVCKVSEDNLSDIVKAMNELADR